MRSAYFDPIRERVLDALRQFLRAKSDELAQVNPMGSAAVNRLLEFSVRGKVIRGCLVHVGWALARGGLGGGPGVGGGRAAGEAAVTAAGAAMELFQSGLLVHDDIMDRDPVRRGRQFERICRWFLTHDPVYARELRPVWLWDEWPGRWAADAGIDLVAEDHRGHLWAIQAKAYDAPPGLPSATSTPSWPSRGGRSSRFAC